MTGVTYYNTALASNEVYAIYKNGPQGTHNILSQIPNWLYLVVTLFIIVLVMYSATS